MDMIFEGAHGPRVLRLQRALIAAGYALNCDSWFGKETDRVLRAYQRDHDLVADGIYGPATAAMLNGTPLPAALKQSDMAAAAGTLGIELAAVIAVTEVEARGEGFIGRLPVVLFERHWMYRQLEKRGKNAAALSAEYPRLINQRPGGYRGGTAENTRLAAARRIDDLSGAESASYGLFQIMGFHAERLGYTDAAAYAEAMGEGEAAHLDAFVRFVQADNTLSRALKKHDWAAFAKRYNGPAYERNDYDTKLAAAYRRHARALDQQEAA